MSQPNTVFILTDQERYFPAWPSGFDVPGRQRLQEAGTTFTNHMIASCVDDGGFLPPPSEPRGTWIAGTCETRDVKELRS